MTRVSVVITNHNYGSYLPEAIESALGQAEQDVETVVVDDGSTDCSGEVLAAYERRVEVLRQPNRGQTAACTAGLEASSGDIVLFLDADDVLLPGAATAALAAFARCPDAVRVSWPLWEIDAVGRRTGGLRPPQRLDRGDLRAVVCEQGPDAYISAPTSGNAWTRDFLRGVLPAREPESFRLGTDAYLAMLAPLFGLLEVVDEPQALYRAHGDNGYWRSSLEYRIDSLLRWYPARVRALSEVRSRQGDPPTAPPSSPYYDWLRRLQRVVRTVALGLPDGRPFLLLDGGEWGERLLTDVPHVPFTERDGVYWGPPADDAAAVAELRRQAARGISHVVVGWPVFWYLDCYPGLLQNLEPVVTTADAHVYRLTVPPSTASSVTP